MELVEGIEPSKAVYKTAVMPFNYTSLVGIVGIEPTTFRLSDERSATELHPMAPQEGFKPPTTWFRRPVLYSLSYCGMVENIRIELMTSGCKPDVLPLAPIPHGTRRGSRTPKETRFELVAYAISAMRAWYSPRDSNSD